MSAHPNDHECRHCGLYIRPTKRDPCIDVRRRRAVEISRRTPVDAGPIYRALLHYSAGEVEAAIAVAVSQGVDPATFSMFLSRPPRLPTTDLDHACETCGETALCGISGHWFCSKHWESGLEDVVAPMLKALHKTSTQP